MLNKGLAALLLLAASACGSSDPVGVDASRVGVVIIDNVAYSGVSDIDVSGAIGAVHATVKRLVDCSKGLWTSSTTHVEEYCPLQDGDSTFLAAGTEIHRVTGALPGERLAYYDKDLSEWVALVPTRSSCNTRASTTGGRLTPPACA